jgi:formate-dependent nitrite reductase cytochrome c552 subunit
VLALSFLALAAVFLFELWGQPQPPPAIPLVDPAFLDTATLRESYAELARKEGDLSGFDCYACHEKNKPVPLHYDANHNLIMPKEHEDIVMNHGAHNRNNNCYNCHDETNLELLQTRDGRELKFADSTALCGSCHGPTYRDWEAGAHGRISGHWHRARGEFKRQDCVDCHDPHAPKFPARKPAPGPNSLRGEGRGSTPKNH